MEPKEVVESALRVLSAWASGDRPSPEDVQIVLLHALLPNEIDLPLDELACLIVKRQCSKVISESVQDRKNTKKRVDKLSKRSPHRKIA